MVDRNRRSTLWFWVLLVALVIAATVVARAWSTSNECDDRATEWSWWPPGFECRSGFR
jgi:hypothetical protein